MKEWPPATNLPDPARGAVPDGGEIPPGAPWEFPRPAIRSRGRGAGEFGGEPEAPEKRRRCHRRPLLRLIRPSIARRVGWPSHTARDRLRVRIDKKRPYASRAPSRCAGY